jgi:hypothetical protein
VICSQRSSARLACPQPQTDCDEHLLTSLCELARRLDPVPEHIAAAARSAFSAATSRPQMQLSTHPIQTEQRTPLVEHDLHP